MGTRHTYRIIETWESNEKSIGTVEKPICLIYGQYDGYENGRPLEVAKFTASGKFVNGYGSDTSETVFNGIGCYTAQLIAHLKDGVGNIYIQSLDSRLNSGEDYTYDIIYNFDTKKVIMIAYDWEGKQLFTGTPEEYIAKYDKQD